MQERPQLPRGEKFGWSKQDAETLEFEKGCAASEVDAAELQAEIDRIDALLQASGLTEAEIAALADELDEE